MTPTWTRISIWDDYACAGGARLADLPEWGEGTTWADRVGGDRGSCVLTLPITSDYVEYLALGNVIRIDDRGDLGTWEYRITGFADGRSADLIAVRGHSPIHELGKCRITVQNGGLTQQAVTSAPITPGDWITDYVLPAATDRGLTWLSLGTVTPTTLLPISFQRQSALWLLAELERQTGYEAFLERTGETGYVLHLATQGASDPSPRMTVGVNVAALERDVATETMFTRTYPVGATEEGSTEPTHIGQACWRVGDPGLLLTGEMTLTDPETDDTSPLAFANQVVGSYATEYLDPVYFRNASTVVAVAVDPGGVAGAVVYAIIQASDTGARVLAYCNTATHVQGRITLSGTPANSPRALGLAASASRLYVNCGATISVVNTATLTESGTITPAATVSGGLWGVGGTKVVIDYADGVTNADVISAMTDTIVGSLTGQAAAWGATAGVFVYDSPTTRIVGLQVGGTDFRWWDAVAYGALGSTALPAAAYAVGPASATGTLYLAFNGAVRDFATGTNTLGSAHTIADVGGEAFTMSTATAPVLGTGVDAQGYTYLAVARNTLVWAVQVNGPAPYEAEVLALPDYAASLVQAGSGLYLGSQFTGLVYRLSMSSRARPAQLGHVTATTPTKVTTAGPPDTVNWQAGSLVEFRADDDLGYLTLLDAPAMLASYGAIDGDTSRAAIVARRNYCRLGSADLWDATDGPVCGSIPYAPVGASGTATRAWDYRAADVAASETITVAASGPVASDVLPCAPLTATLLPGDCLQASGGGVTGRAWVRQRAVAGATSVAITSGNFSGAISPSVTFTAYRSKPTLPQGATNCVVLYPTGGDGARPPSLIVDVPIPAIPADSTVHVVALLAARVFSSTAYLGGVRLGAYAPGSLVETTVTSDSTTDPGTADLEEWGLSIPLSIPATVTRAGYVRVRIVCAPGAGDSWLGTLYVRSLMVLVAPIGTTQLTSPIRFSHANALWRAGNTDLAQAGPTITYRVQAIEDDPDGRPFVVGATADLHDPDFGIEHAAPRIVEVQYTPTPGSEDGTVVPVRFPTLTLGSREKRLTDAIAALETA